MKHAGTQETHASLVLAVAIISLQLTGCGNTENLPSRSCDETEIVLAPAESAMHPEGIPADDDGNIYVSGFISKNIVRVRPCGAPTEFVPAGTIGNAAGILFDSLSNSLWVCESDFGETPPNPRVSWVDLANGRVVATHRFPPGSGICNDMTVDGDQNLYLTDSFANRIVRIPADRRSATGEVTDSVAVWSEDPAFGTIRPGTFGLNGIAWGGGRDLYVAAFHGNAGPGTEQPPSRRHRVPIVSDGTAGSSEVVGDNPFGDGLEWLGGRAFLVNEQSSVVSLLALGEEDAIQLTPLATGLDFSTTSVVVGDSFWVVEGQLDHFLDPSLGPATEPFRIRRFNLP